MPEIEIWSIDNCPKCEIVKHYLKSMKLTFTEKSLEGLKSGKTKDEEALVELAINDGAAPLIRYEGNFVTESELKMLLQGSWRAVSDVFCEEK